MQNNARISNGICNFDSELESYDCADENNFSSVSLPKNLADFQIKKDIEEDNYFNKISSKINTLNQIVNNNTKNIKQVEVVNKENESSKGHQ